MIYHNLNSINMRIKEIKKYQQGGPMASAAPGAEAAPAAAPQGGAEDQLAALAEELVNMLMEQIQNPSAVAAVLQMALEMVQGAAAPEAPVFRAGGKLAKKAKKACGGMSLGK